MSVTKDPRDSLRINLQVEDALKIGKLLGTQYDAVALCRDGHRSSQMIEQALISGILSTGGNVYLAGECPAPAMPYARSGCDCYVTIAADDREKMGGIIIHHPDGSYFDEMKIHSLFSKEERILYPKYDGIGEVHKLYGINNRYVEEVCKNVMKANTQVILDGMHIGPTSLAANILKECESDVLVFNRSRLTSVMSISEYTSSDLESVMKSYPGSIAAALSNDGSRIMVFDESGKPVNNWALAALLVKILRPTQVVAPVDVSLAVTDLFINKDRGDDEDQDDVGNVIKVNRNIKRIVDYMRERNNQAGMDYLKGQVQFGMDSKGRFIFPQISYTPDGIFALALLAEYASENSISEAIKPFAIKDITNEYDVSGEASYYTIRKDMFVNISEEDFTTRMVDEVTSLGNRSIFIVVMDGIRVEFEDGWMFFDFDAENQCVHILCEARDKAYVVSLLDMGISFVEAITISD